MKIIIHFVIAAWLITLFYTESQGQISSTVSGGDWSEPLTWIGETVPGADDDVIINGPVAAPTTACQNLTVNTGGILFNAVSASTLTVNGNLINNGTIRNHLTSGYGFSINLYGNFTNNQVFDNEALYLYGTAHQYLTLLAGETISSNYLMSFKPGGKLEALTDIDLTNCMMNMNYDSLILQNGGRISVHGQSIWNVIAISSEGTSGTLQLWMDNNAYIKGCEFYNAELLGEIKCTTTSFSGYTVNSGILSNTQSYHNVHFNGPLENNGSIINDPVLTVGLSLYLKGDIVNNGTWECWYTWLNGSYDQHVTCLNNNPFACDYFYITNSTGSVYFDAENYFENVEIAFNGYDLYVSENAFLSVHDGFIQNGQLIGTGESSVIHGEGSFSVDAPFLQSLQLSDVAISGKFGLRSGITMNGTITNEATLQNDESSQSINVYGDLINNGNIRDEDFGVSTLTIYTTGDIYNNGFWTNNLTQLNGTVDQHITILNGHSIMGNNGYQSDIAIPPYQWIRNGYQLPPAGEYTGETSETIIFNIPVTPSSNYSILYCQTGGGPSRNIYFHAMDSQFSLDLKVFLEGPYDLSTHGMSTDLNSDNYIPFNQPFYPSTPYYNEDNPTWLYNGSESVTFIPSNAVDWVLVQLRDADLPENAGSSTMIGQQAAFVLNNGTIVGMDGVSQINFDLLISQNLYVVVFHRNHLAVISANALVESGGVYTYDFTTSANQALGGTNGHKELEPGVWGMVAGDGNGNGLIQNTDETAVWKTDLGQSGYKGGDFDMNGLVQNTDETNYWKVNLGSGGQTPVKGNQTGYKSQVPK